MSRVRVSCLRCHHEGVLTEGYLARYGVEADVPLVTLSRRLRCSRCDSHAVIIDRLPNEHDEAPPPTVPDL